MTIQHLYNYWPFNIVSNCHNFLPVPRLPTIETIENCMKLSPMIVQGLWEYKSPLLQLPYITEDHLKYFTNRKKHIKSLLQLAQLPGEERRQVLRFLNDKQYEDLMKVLGNMPYIHFQVNTEGNVFCLFID